MIDILQFWSYFLMKGVSDRPRIHVSPDPVARQRAMRLHEDGHADLTGEVEDVLGHLRPNELIRLYVPSRDCQGRRLRHRRLIRLVSQRLIAAGKGLTTWMSDGFYLGHDGRLIKERTAIAEVCLKREVTAGQKAQVLSCLQLIATEGNQEVVAVAIGARYFEIAGDVLRSEDIKLRRVP